MNEDRSMLESTFDISDAPIFRRMWDARHVRIAEAEERVVIRLHGLDVERTAYPGDLIATDPSNGHRSIAERDTYSPYYEKNDKTPSHYVSTQFFYARVLTEDTDIHIFTGQILHPKKGDVALQNVYYPRDVSFVDSQGFESGFARQLNPAGPVRLNESIYLQWALAVGEGNTAHTEDIQNRMAMPSKRSDPFKPSVTASSGFHYRA